MATPVRRGELPQERGCRGVHRLDVRAGEPTWNEDYGDDVKLLGVYSTEERALERANRARRLPGFRDELECFSCRSV